jgi:hypothetical protein
MTVLDLKAAIMIKGRSHVTSLHNIVEMLSPWDGTSLGCKCTRWSSDMKGSTHGRDGKCIQNFGWKI